MFSCELCEIFKNTFFTEHFRATASGETKPISKLDLRTAYVDMLLLPERNFETIRVQKFLIILIELMHFLLYNCPNDFWISFVGNLFNSFFATDLFLYPLKTSENLWFSNNFRGYRKGPVAWNRLKEQWFAIIYTYF